jgi:RES domain-containing protein
LNQPATTLYRVLRRAYSSVAFSGEGSYLYGGRWSSAGTRLTYTSEHQSLAMLEYFVHLDPDDPPHDLVLASAKVPAGLPREVIMATNLPRNWRETPAPPELAKIGDDFVQRPESCILIVPSVLATNEGNWLLNPQHSDFQKIDFRDVDPLSYDPRMFESKRLASKMADSKRARGKSRHRKRKTR